MSRAEYYNLKRPYSENFENFKQRIIEGVIEDYYNDLINKKVWNTKKFKTDQQLHTDSSEEARKEKKLKFGGSINNRYNILSKKLNDMPEVQYRYLKGESKEN